MVLFYTLFYNLIHAFTDSMFFQTIVYIHVRQRLIYGLVPMCDVCVCMCMCACMCVCGVCVVCVRMVNL